MQKVEDEYRQALRRAVALLERNRQDGDLRHASVLKRLMSAMRLD